MSRYDPEGFVTFTAEDGLPSDYVAPTLSDKDGNLWFNTNAGAVRYDGRNWAMLTTADGQPFKGRPFFQDQEGNTWFGINDRGAVRYDGSTFTFFTSREGLAGDDIREILRDRRGDLWFATGWSGATRYDGRIFTTFTRADGLMSNWVRSLLEDRDGHIWVGTLGGVGRYDGSTFTSSRMGERIYSILQDRSGDLWFGTGSHGVSRYDGQDFTTYTTRQGLGSSYVNQMVLDRREDLWLSTYSGGVTRYDGKTWTILNTADGLASNMVWGMLEDRNGDLWFGSRNGLTRYRQPSHSPPPAYIDAVVADRRYTSISDLSLPSSAGIIAFEFHGVSLKTRPNGMIYRYRLAGHDDGWQTTRKRRLEYEDLPRGDYRFEVEAVDRDGVYSKIPASVVLTVRQPYGQIVLVSLLGLAVVLVVWQTARVIRRDRRLQQSNAALSDANKELFSVNQNLGQKTSDLEAANVDLGEKTTALEQANKKLDESNTAMSSANKELFGLNLELQRDRAVDRVRAEVTAMSSAEDLQDVLRGMLKELSEAGVDFDLCEINIVNEGTGICTKYGATKQGWSEQVKMPLTQMSDAFMEIYRAAEPVVRDVTDELADLHVEVRRQARMAGETARPTAVLDVPFTYGTLSLNTLNPEKFSEEDVSLVKELARVIDLGYARYLDLRALQRDRAVEHIRGGVQAMERAADFEEVLSSVADDVKAMGLAFDTCGIDVLDEPVEEPTMAYFEERGFRCTTYTIDPEGSVSRESYHTPAPFPPVNQETIQRFIEGKPWTGSSGDTSIVEVPFAAYGRLRLTSADREEFGEDDIETLEEFAAAIALGYTRYLDFQDLEAKNKRLEEVDAAKTDFLSGVAHELRTPMTAIKGFAENILDGIGGKPSDQHAGYLSRIRSNADRLTRMVNDLLDLSRIDRGRTDLIDLNIGKLPIHDVVQATVEDLRPLADEKGLKLTVEADEAHGMADRDRLTQVVTNLVGNAIKFTETGEVSVTVRSDGQGNVQTAVRDTGRGIPADSLERVFERLYQVRDGGEARQGSGLGLAISKEFVELMGGKIWAESEVGRGSAFTFTVPEG